MHPSIGEELRCNALLTETGKIRSLSLLRATSSTHDLHRMRLSGNAFSTKGFWSGSEASVLVHRHVSQLWQPS